MTLNIFTKIKLFHTNFRRTHENIYGFIYRIYMVLAIAMFLLSLGYFNGTVSFATPEDAYEMFSFSTWYFLITIFILPTILGLTKWKKYLLPGTYKTTTKEMAKEILKTEEFRNPIPILDEREKKHRFLESANYFWFEGQLIPKSEIDKIDFEYSMTSKRYTFNIIFKNGSRIKNIYGELAASASKYKDNPITDYLKAK